MSDRLFFRQAVEEVSGTKQTNRGLRKAEFCEKMRQGLVLLTREHRSDGSVKSALRANPRGLRHKVKVIQSRKTRLSHPIPIHECADLSRRRIEQDVLQGKV